MTQTLLAQLDGRTVGRVQRLRTGGLRFSFTYDDAWRNDADAYPLSLSMPLSASEHRHPIIEAFLWGLLPDNEIILDRWAKRFHVSPRNAFALIAEVGEDCAGAVQFIRPERLADGASPDPEPEWLDEKAIGDRLRALRADISATRLPRDTGQFSLPGAQAKTALLLDGGRWGVPSGRTPTTHILKPPMGDLDGHADDAEAARRLQPDLVERGGEVVVGEVRAAGRQGLGKADGELALAAQVGDRLAQILHQLLGGVGCGRVLQADRLGDAGTRPGVEVLGLFGGDDVEVAEHHQRDHDAAIQDHSGLHEAVVEASVPVLAGDGLTPVGLRAQAVLAVLLGLGEVVDELLPPRRGPLHE